MFRPNWQAILFCSCFLTIIATALHPAVGQPPENFALNFDGAMDELRIWNTGYYNSLLGL